jgi:hypothetical protein
LVFEEKFCNEILPALKFGYEGDSIFIFHGHQASLFYENYNYIANFVLRYLANPLRIKNHSPAYDSKRDTKLKSMSIIFPAKINCSPSLVILTVRCLNLSPKWIP